VLVGRDSNFAGTALSGSEKRRQNRAAPVPTPTDRRNFRLRGLRSGRQRGLPTTRRLYLRRQPRKRADRDDRACSAGASVSADCHDGSGPAGKNRGWMVDGLHPAGRHHHGERTAARQPRRTPARTTGEKVGQPRVLRVELAGKNESRVPEARGLDWQTRPPGGRVGQDGQLRSPLDSLVFAAQRGADRGRVESRLDAALIRKRSCATSSRFNFQLMAALARPAGSAAAGNVSRGARRAVSSSRRIHRANPRRICGKPPRPGLKDREIRSRRCTLFLP